MKKRILSIFVVLTATFIINTNAQAEQTIQYQSFLDKQSEIISKKLENIIFFNSEKRLAKNEYQKSIQILKKALNSKLINATEIEDIFKLNKEVAIAYQNVEPSCLKLIETLKNSKDKKEIEIIQHISLFLQNFIPKRAFIPVAFNSFYHKMKKAVENGAKIEDIIPAINKLTAQEILYMSQMVQFSNNELHDFDKLPGALSEVQEIFLNGNSKIVKLANRFTKIDKMNRLSLIDMGYIDNNTPDGTLIENEMAMRDQGESIVNNILGLHVIVPTNLGENAQKGVVSVMDKAPGLSASVVIQQKNFNINSLIQKNCAELDLVDAICGQFDRHNKNFFIDGNHIIGIDNDYAFGLSTSIKEAKNNYYSVKLKNGAFPFISREMAEKIKSLNPDTIVNALYGVINYGNNGEKRLQAVKGRILEIKNYVLENEKIPGFIVEEYDAETVERYMQLRKNKRIYGSSFNVIINGCDPEFS
ncbi:MAG: hypothetical protein LBT69_05405 [Lactobacillales bacterium]|jgi:hypothetical protein|nr:hypothetical protein [Lactobacillales bacterium]